MYEITFTDRPENLNKEDYSQAATFQAQKTHYSEPFYYEKYHPFEDVIKAIVNHDEVVEDCDLWHVSNHWGDAEYVFRIHRPDSLNINVYMFKRN